MKNFNYFFFLVFIIVSVIFYLKISKIEEDNTLLQKIDELELKINSLQSKKDSIRTVIDSTHVKIITNEEHYQEVINTIITQPTSEDFEFVRGYIGQYRNKMDSLNIR